MQSVSQLAFLYVMLKCELDINYVNNGSEMLGPVNI